jgi:hypothetical protein
MRARIRILRAAFKAQKEALRKASPKSRERIRQRVKVLEVALSIEKERRAA